MNRRQRFARRLRRGTIVFITIALGLGLIGAIMMASDADYSRAVGQERAMLSLLSFLGCFFLIGALIMLFLSRTRPLLAIGTCVATVVGYVLFLATSTFIKGDAEPVGYDMIVTAGYMAAFSVELCIPYIILSMIKGRRQQPPIIVEPHVPYAKKEEDRLGDAQALYDGGLLSEEEYEREKEAIFEEFRGRTLADLQGRYRRDKTVVAIKEGSFFILYEDRVLKSGRAKLNADGNGLTLIDGEGKRCFFYVKENAIETKEGTRYDRV